MPASLYCDGLMSLPTPLTPTFQLLSACFCSTGKSVLFYLLVLDKVALSRVNRLCDVKPKAGGLREIDGPITQRKVNDASGAKRRKKTGQQTTVGFDWLRICCDIFQSVTKRSSAKAKKRDFFSTARQQS